MLLLLLFCFVLFCFVFFFLGGGVLGLLFAVVVAVFLVFFFLLGYDISQRLEFNLWAVTSFTR